MGKRKRRNVNRPHDLARGRWRAVVFVSTILAAAAVVLAVNLVGPGRRVANTDDGPHDHPPGPHGGAVVAIDRDNRFHAEAVLEAGGRLHLYTFGRELTEVRPLKARTVCAAVRGQNGADEYAVMLRADPQAIDPPATASQFVGRLPPAMWQDHLRLIVWSLPIDGERFRFEIDSPNLSPDAAATERAIAAESARYTTPGGKYCAADIEANGRLPASQKYRGERPAHNHEPAAGDRVCPVSRLRADPRFVWIVGRGQYQFCCPPCIDEFVMEAKERPDEVREPDFYRHK